MSPKQAAQKAFDEYCQMAMESGGGESISGVDFRANAWSFVEIDCSANWQFEFQRQLEAIANCL